MGCLNWTLPSSVVSLTEPGEEDAILKQWWLQTKGELPPNLVVWWFLYKIVFSFLLIGRETYQVALNVLCSSRSWRPAQRTATIYASQGWNRWDLVKKCFFNKALEDLFCLAYDSSETPHLLLKMHRPYVDVQLQMSSKWSIIHFLIYQILDPWTKPCFLKNKT